MAWPKGPNLQFCCGPAGGTDGGTELAAFWLKTHQQSTKRTRFIFLVHPFCHVAASFWMLSFSCPCFRTFLRLNLEHPTYFNLDRLTVPTKKTKKQLAFLVKHKPISDTLATNEPFEMRETFGTR